MNGLRTFIALLALLGAGQIAYGATEISGNIEDDTVWSSVGSPYIITAEVLVGTPEIPATLTIEPGTVVKFYPDTWLAIYGNLIANGTASANIYFTSNRNNSLGGDTDIDNIEPTSSDSWAVIMLNSFGNQLSHVNTSFSLGGLQIQDGALSATNLNLSDNSNSLIVNGGSLELSHSRIARSYPVLVLDGSAGFDHIDFSSSSILTSNSTVSIKNVSIKNSGTSAVALYDSDANIIDSQLLSGFGEGIVVSDSILNTKNINVSDFYGDGIVTYEDSIVTGNNLVLANNFGHGIANYASDITITRSKILDNAIGLANYGYLAVNNSTVSGNLTGAQAYSTSPMIARNNYWGDSTGPYHEMSNPAGLGDSVTDYVEYDPWLTEFCETDCHSNIMFLPGIMSSRLYENGEQLWEGHDNDVVRLHLDAIGKSMSDQIVTRDIIETFDAPWFFDRNIYASFLHDLETTKTTGVINDYETVPYDWRLALPQILSGGTKDPSGNISYLETTSEPYIEKTLRDLAASSKSGKVTIVAHSNGGLITKALINRLGGEAAQLIDQVIFVAVPQLGTPKAIGSLLHGYDTGIRLMLSDEAARAFAQNSPMTYHLLPFSDYYSGSGHTIGTPYVTFDDGTATQTFINEYGYAITNAEELYSFLTAAEGRATPDYDDTHKPTIANKVLLDEAITVQSSINSTWEPPNGIKIHQIAGTGARTPARIHYETIQDCKLSVIVCVGGYEDILSYDVEEVIDGDGTVVLPSALAMSDGSEQVKRWWVNLETFNAPAFGVNRTHADILEIAELRDFIFNNLLTNTISVLPNYISSTEPSLEEKDRLIFTLHSPLSLSAIDATGRVVNEQEVTIPGAHYARYGEIQKLSVPTGTQFTLVLTGEAEGSFTLKAIETRDREIANTITLSAIPSATSTIGQLDFENGSLAGAGPLQLDYDGDGVVEVTYTPALNETVTAPDYLLKEGATRNDDVRFGGRSKVTQSAQDLEAAVKLIQLIAERLKELNNTSIITSYQYENATRQIQQILVKILSALTK